MTVTEAAPRLAPFPAATPGGAPGNAAPGNAGADLLDRTRSAVLTCIARDGIARTSVEAVAREAGCSRATLYRTFGPKPALVAAAVAAELDRVGAVAASAGRAAPTLAAAIADVLVAVVGEARTSAALTRVRACEPGLIEPHLAFAGGDRLLARVATALTPAFADRAADPSRTAAWTARLALVLVFAPHPPVAVADADAVRAWVARHAAPGLSTLYAVTPARSEEDR